MGRALEADAGVEDGPDPESRQDLDQPGDVILVRMAQHEQVDAAREEREIGAQPAEGELGVRTTIDEHGGAVRRLDQDRVTLTDVQHGDVQEAVRP
jgi:hypothetical protein